jgi:DNA repair exonuclease SbcCD ATPase subunit
MITRIIGINTSTYVNAEMRLDDCDSLQLVGPNNVGKSTLIYTLNFLFIVDGSKMSFSGQRRGDKETIHHYFPTHNQSYIVFEILKNSTYYCILVKRDSDGELEYYRFNSDYKQEYFFKKDGTSQRIRKWDEVQEELTAAAIELYLFKSKTEIFNSVYSRGRRNDAVVWLEESVRTDGLSNNFSKVYRYLINSKLITNKTLKESLIIADNRENEGLSFSQKNKKDINDLLRINDEIRTIKGIQKDFEEFREVVNLFKAKNRIVSDLVYAFEKQYSGVINELDSSRLDKEKTFQTSLVVLNEKLKPRQEELNREIGKKETEVEIREKEFISLQTQLEEINSFEDKKFLEESLVNLDQRRKDTEVRITMVENQKLNSKQLEAKLSKLDDECNRLDAQIKNYDNQLIQKIAGKDEDRKLLNTIFSPEFAAQSADLVKKKVSKVGASMTIFDGEVKLPKDLKLKDIPSVKMLKDELAELKKEKTELEKLWAVALHFDKAQKDLNKILEEIETVKSKLRRIDEKPIIQERSDELGKELRVMKAEKDKIEEDLNKLKKEISEKTLLLESLREETRRNEERIIELKKRKQEIESFGITPTEYETTESLDEIYNKIRMSNQDRESLKTSKDRMFDALRFKTNSALADETEFIKFVEDEIACITDKEKSIDGLLGSISTQFANPAYNLRKRYEEFKAFVYNRFNESLAKTRISNIESLKIELVDNKRVLYDLERISAIENLNAQLAFEFDQGEDLKILNQYLDSGKTIDFEDLFDIELLLDVKGHLKRVDLKEQVESDGTDRMIRLVIVMAIINRLAISSPENKIALFIDEIGTIDEHNRPQLVAFCKEHNFIPIFAAPQPYDGFSKYYFIFRSKGKINVNDKQHAVRREELKLEN